MLSLHLCMVGNAVAYRECNAGRHENALALALLLLAELLQPVLVYAAQERSGMVTSGQELSGIVRAVKRRDEGSASGPVMILCRVQEYLKYT